MGQTRRNFLKLAGAAGLGAAAAPRALAAAQGKARTVAARGNGNAGPKELPRNMTFCTLRRDGRYVLGVRTQRGVLDVERAAKALRRQAPSTIDNLPQKVAKKFDYEVELVVVMGKTARDVPKEKALDYVFGYCVGNDFSARDLQFKTPQLMLGKTSDGFGPIGPWLVTADQIPNVQ